MILATLRNLQYKQNQWNTEDLERIFYHIITAIRASYLTVSFKDSLVWHSTGQFQSFHMNEKVSGYGWVIVLLKPSFASFPLGSLHEAGFSDSKNLQLIIFFLIFVNNQISLTVVKNSVLPEYIRAQCYTMCCLLIFQSSPVVTCT